ncbi:MAG TPA: LTA synthase family protein [Desulfuromonadaceae bacterium]|jgi:phosphoglycerol transferase MdoB-like AlkP superfamily enzyme
MPFNLKELIVSVTCRSKESRIQPQALFLCFLVANALKCWLAYISCDSSGTDLFLLLNYLESFLLALLVYGGLAAAGRASLLFVFYLVQGLYLAINVCYLNLFNSPLHLNYYYQLWWEFFSISDKFTALPALHSLFLALMDLPLLIAVAFRLRSTPRLFRPTLCRGLFLTVFASLALSLMLVFSELSSPVRLKSLSSKPAAYNAIVLHRYGILAHNLLDLFTADNEKQELLKLSHGEPISGKGSCAIPPEIFMIQVESLDANIIDFNWHGRYVAPFLHQISRQSLYFPFTMSYHLAGGSSDCEVSVLNSVEPFSSFPTMTSGRYDYPNSLARVLGGRGMVTLAFHGNDGNYYNRDQAYYKMDFDKFYDRLRMGLPEEGWGASDQRLFEFAEKKIAQLRRPFLCYLITMSSHEPFRNVENYFNDSAYDDVEPEITRHYFKSISYVDQVLREFVSHVRANYPHAYIFIYGDHTPYVIKKGLYQRAAFMMDDKEFEFVPLLIVTPSKQVRMEQKLAVSFLDIAPTVLAASGVPYRFRTTGENLLEKPLIRPIPFREDSYDRALLYREAQKTRKNLFLDER